MLSMGELMPLGPTLLPAQSTSTITTTSISSTATASASSSSASSTSSLPVVPIAPGRYGSSLIVGNQTCNTACAISIPVILVSLLCIGLLYAWWHHRKSKRTSPQKYHAAPLASAVAAGSNGAHSSTSSATLASPELSSAELKATTKATNQGSLAQRFRGLFVKSSRPASGEVISDIEGKQTSTLRGSFRRDPRKSGYVDLEAGHAQNRYSSVMSGAVGEFTFGEETERPAELETRSQMSGVTLGEALQDVNLGDERKLAGQRLSER
ncbi:hypothetical protein MMC13_000753 [Lambiella insularis]|nr:hypothetical protein [Lambiella insularis]